VTRKPTDAELIAAGWKSPPPPPPTETSLLWQLYQMREEGPRVWTVFGADDDAVLHRLHQRAPWLLRHKVTKGWGDMWRLANF